MKIAELIEAYDRAAHALPAAGDDEIREARYAILVEVSRLCRCIARGSRRTPEPAAALAYFHTWFAFTQPWVVVDTDWMHPVPPAMPPEGE